MELVLLGAPAVRDSPGAGSRTPATALAPATDDASWSNRTPTPRRRLPLWLLLLRSFGRWCVRRTAVARVCAGAHAGRISPTRRRRQEAICGILGVPLAEGNDNNTVNTVGEAMDGDA